MDPFVFALVAASAVLHVAWNVLLKTAGDPLRTSAVGMLAGTAVAVPLAVIAWLASGQTVIPPAAVLLGVGSGIIEAAYFVFLAAAYRRGDLSVVYPIARGTAPLLAVLVGVVVLGERLGPTGFLGVALLLVGLAMLQRPWRFLGRGGEGPGGGRSGLDPAVPFAVATGVTIVAYTAVDRVAVQQLSPWIYAGIIWPICAGALWLWIVAGRGRAAAPRPASATTLEAAPPLDPPRAALGGVITFVAYALILVALSLAPMSAVAPLRESAIVLATGWGAFKLGEATDRGDAAGRLAAAALVVVGAVLLAVG